MKNVAPFILLIVGGLLAYFFYFNKGAKVGAQTPEVASKMIDGTDFKLSDLKGKKVYLVFWGSWCGPCRAELPHWVSFYNNKNDENIEVVSIALEKRAGASQGVADAMGFSWKYQIEENSSFVATNGLARKYGVTDIPAAFLINEDGTLEKKITQVPH